LPKMDRQAERKRSNRSRRVRESGERHLRAAKRDSCGSKQSARSRPLG
jgi:hypothetical protein